MAGRLARALSAIEERFTPAEECRPCAETVITAETPTFGSYDAIGTPPPCVSDPIPRVRAEAPPAFEPTPFAAGDLGEWQRALSRMRIDEPPCAGFRHWPSVHRAAMRFLHERGEEAIALGWGVLDLFGVHHEVGALRSDCCGALLGLTGRPVFDLTPHLIRFADGLAYRRRPRLTGITIPIWLFDTTTGCP